MTQKWLVPIDGSDIALHAVAWVEKHAADYREPPQIHLINVQAVLPDDIGRFIDAETLREFHLEAGMKALAAARNQLTAAGKAVILVSSELPELIGMSDRILMLNEGRIGGSFTHSEATQEKLMAAAMGHAG